jgi:hypothetical protein
MSESTNTSDPDILDAIAVWLTDQGFDHDREPEINGMTPEEWGRDAILAPIRQLDDFWLDIEPDTSGAADTADQGITISISLMDRDTPSLERAVREFDWGRCCDHKGTFRPGVRTP